MNNRAVPGEYGLGFLPTLSGSLPLLYKVLYDV